MIGIVIPAHNEEHTVGVVVRDIRATLPDAHIVVVDDRSRDATSSVARNAGAEVVRTPVGLGGYAQALQRGYQAAIAAGALELTDNTPPAICTCCSTGCRATTWWSAAGSLDPDTACRFRVAPASRCADG